MSNCYVLFNKSQEAQLKFSPQVSYLNLSSDFQSIARFKCNGGTEMFRLTVMGAKWLAKAAAAYKNCTTN